LAHLRAFPASHHYRLRASNPTDAGRARCTGLSDKLAWVPINLSDHGTRKHTSTLLDWRRREEAVMVAIELDDHTFSLLCEADEKIRHTVLVIEQLRLHIAALHPTRRDLEAKR
jgi:hypothetical protein